MSDDHDRWIPITELIPESGQEVLAFRSGDPYPVVARMIWGFGPFPDAWELSVPIGVGDRDGWQPTHWKGLGDLPKKDEEE